MPSTVKLLVRAACTRVVFATGIALAIRRLLWRDRVAVLLYHDPDAATLDSHLTYLKSVCDLVPLAHATRRGSGRPRAAITLDDGHARNALLLPVFIKHGVRPTIFICSSIVAHERKHWWFDAGAHSAGVETLKRLSNKQRQETLRERGFTQEARVDADAVTGLTREQIDAMRPYVDFQSHTRFHPILTHCDDTECHDELAGSKREVEALSGEPCEHFAYPNGDYGAREIAALEASGYRSARTCDIGWNDDRTQPYCLKAFDIPDTASASWFAMQLTGIPLYLRYLRQGGGLGGRKPQVRPLTYPLHAEN